MALALLCGDARWPGERDGVEQVAVPARPQRADLAPVLDGLDGRRLVVCGTDADLAAVALRLQRDEVLESVTVGYVPSSTRSAVARLWGVARRPRAAAARALSGQPRPVPLLRDDGGGVLVGRGMVRPVDGVAYCDEQRVLRGRAAWLQVVPDAARGLLVRVRHRRLTPRGTRAATGRAVQLGAQPTGVWRDGVPARMSGNRWTWYRHTSDLRLVR